MKKLLLLGFLVMSYSILSAAVFTSTDGQVSMELPSAWSVALKPANGAVLSVVKDKARIDIKKVPNCDTEACIEQKVQADLADVKSKNMQVVGNTYTGEEIKRLDFSTGEPLFYISFFTPKNDFSAGYFLINKQGYSILAKDLSYAQTDLIFSFIAPANKANQATLQPGQPLEMDLNSERAYDIESVPDVQEEELTLQTPPAQLAPTTPTKAQKPSVRRHRRIPSLVTSHMPLYIQQMGRGFDALILLLGLYVFLQIFFLLLRLFVKPRAIASQGNENSAYPIRFQRRYGTPSLIFRATDNQKNVFLSLSSRWDSVFFFMGTLLIIGTMGALAFISLLERTHWITLSAHTTTTLYSTGALLIPLGFIIFFCGMLWTQLVLRKFAIYNKTGQRIIYILQRGLFLRKECYLIYFVNTRENLWLERKCFSLRRCWTLMDKNRTPLARITEKDLLPALIRKFTGHLWGFLRASYDIELPCGEKGTILNSRACFNRFAAHMENPDGLQARDVLATALVINIRDRDKWYPWF